MIPQPPRGIDRPPRRTYGRSSTTAAAAAAGGGAGVVPGPSGVPVGPLPLPTTLPPRGSPPATNSTPRLPAPSSPYSTSRPTETTASPKSTSPGERRKPPGTWAARVARAQEDTDEEEGPNTNNRDGRLVEYSGSESEGEGDQDCKANKKNPVQYSGWEGYMKKIISTRTRIDNFVQD